MDSIRFLFLAGVRRSGDVRDRVDGDGDVDDGVEDAAEDPEGGGEEEREDW